ncbi:MAG: hypothetical protein E6K49_14660 [Gammaproteobacteria bacterium]|nr:MAG: hypothetical protein E6K49_14660 [Gammaproteobacteria bacterium]
MQTLIIVLVALHVVAGVFWAGSTWALARAGGESAHKLFRPQMGAATLAILAGIGLWSILHRGARGPMEATLALGALFAIAAVSVQGALRRKSPLLSQRIAAGLLAVTVLCMATARYVG